MTRNVTVTVATQPTQIATALASGGLIVSLINSAGTVFGTPQTVAPGTSYVANFADVPADTYTATAQSVDTSGQPVGAVVTSAPFAVVDLPPAATFAYDVPVSVTIAAQ